MHNDRGIAQFLPKSSQNIILSIRAFESAVWPITRECKSLRAIHVMNSWAFTQLPIRYVHIHAADRIYELDKNLHGDCDVMIGLFTVIQFERSSEQPRPFTWSVIIS